MKKIGFLSFGHWSSSAQSATRSASDVLLQSIDLAVAAEELGADGAYFRVHHFAQQLASPFPLLAAVGTRTSRIEIGTGVIDMRYENPFYMAEDAGSADLISGGRLQLGISRGSPEQVVEGWRHFGYAPAEGETDADMGRRRSRARTRCFPIHQGCCASNRMRQACGGASGGVRRRTPPRSGQRKTA
jgi:alkanesulfonate monooxygenase SsuD/methylene tetrahydromethanopterin reductase-like flavin-dependent oxidoreductase (luciferase family)